MSPRTHFALRALHPAVARKAGELLHRILHIEAREQCTFEVISGYRSSEKQDDLYALGRTKPGRIVTQARGGSSWHNFGLAFDLGVFRDGFYLDEAHERYTTRLYREIAPIAQAIGLEPGVLFKRFPDPAHFQDRLNIATPHAAKKRLQRLNGQYWLLGQA